MSALGNAALELARRGLKIFPCGQRSKDPLSGSHGYKDATDSPLQIEAWWQANPNFNVAVATGPASGFWALDVDADKGGEATLRQWEGEHGELPATVEVITGRGRHLWFKWPEADPGCNLQTQERFDMPGVDARGRNGYILVPPSRHPNGKQYAWSVDSGNSLTAAPDWLIRIIARSDGPVEAHSPEQWRSFISEDVDGSRRRPAIARLYGLLARSRTGYQWLDQDVAVEICRCVNAVRCKPPLTDLEIRKICDGIQARENARRGA